MRTHRIGGVRRVILTALLVVAASAFVAAAMPARADLAGTEVKIGALLPLTGTLGFLGMQQRVALEIAQEEINAAGGVGGKPFRFIVYDTERKEASAIKAMRRLIAENVLAIFGPLSCRIAEAVFPISNREKIPTITNSCGAPNVMPKHRPWTFGNSMTEDKLSGPIIARWVKEHGIKRAVILYDKADDISRGYGAFVAPKMLQANGVEVVDNLTFLTADVDYSAQITRARALNVNGLVIGALAEQAAHIMREVQKQGLTVPVLGNQPITGYNFINLGGKAAEGVWAAATFWDANPNPKTKAFVEKFMKRDPQKNPPHAVAAGTYDSTSILKMIIEQRGVTNRPEDLASDREKIRQGWAALKNYAGVMGLTSINEVGDGLKESYTIKVKDGKWVRVE
ncbi:MAG: ABC transporter substrate-binding protein [Candidatus Tectomicrobia bacterium]|nr:ABC transporter substrate-binding protein [Candidatus Tectomicrobia bacterium]